MGMTSNHTHVDGKGGTCHGFAAVNLEFFGNAEEIKKHLSVFLDELRNSPKADDYLGMDFEKYFGKIELDKEYHNFY